MPQTTWHILATLILCVLAFCLGRQRRGTTQRTVSRRVIHSRTRARKAARQLRKITEELVDELSRYRSRLHRFEQTVATDEMDVMEIDRTLALVRRLSSDLGLARLRVGEQIDQLLVYAESRIDPLTGVGNRRLFEEELQSMVEEQRHSKRAFAMVHIDVDRFKEVNDTLGHPAGDALLVQIGRLLVNQARGNDVVTRIGGDEFAVIMRNTNLAGAARLTERIREAVEGVQLPGLDHPLTVSAGIVVPSEGESAESLMARVDAALYCAKQEGRNQIRVNDDGMMFRPSPEELAQAVTS